MGYRFKAKIGDALFFSFFLVKPERGSGRSGFIFCLFYCAVGILDHHGRAGWRAAGVMVGVALVGMVIRAAGA